MTERRAADESPEDAAEHAPRSRNRVGEVIDGKYDVVRFLGEGGVGVVYEARHRVVGRRFAIKFLHEEVARSSSMVTRFRREAEAAGRLESENVVAVVDFGSERGTPYLVMEYLDGENLAQLLARTGPLPVGRAVEIVEQVCRGLEAAHARGIIHRDLKPENVFVVRRGDGRDLVKILDFGIAKLVEEGPGGITHSGTTLGTPHYMSPEQARGDRTVDVRTDVYSLGVILYELLSGAKPHPGENATAVLFHLLKQEPARVDALRSGLPRDLADSVHRAFAFEASDRFSTVAELTRAISAYREHREEAAPRGPPANRGASAAPSTTLLQTSQTLSGRSAAASSDAPRRTRDALGRAAWLVPIAVLACTGAAIVASRRADSPGPAPATASPIRERAGAPSASTQPDPPERLEAGAEPGEANDAAVMDPRAAATSQPAKPAPAVRQGLPRPATTATAPPHRRREDLYEP